MDSEKLIEKIGALEASSAKLEKQLAGLTEIIEQDLLGPVVSLITDWRDMETHAQQMVVGKLWDLHQEKLTEAQKAGGHGHRALADVYTEEAHVVQTAAHLLTKLATSNLTFIDKREADDSRTDTTKDPGP